MKETYEYHGRVIEYEYEDPVPGERPSVIEWRRKNALSRALAAFQETIQHTGFQTAGAQLHEAALTKLFGPRHRPRVSSVAELLEEASKDRRHRRGGH